MMRNTEHTTQHMTEWNTRLKQEMVQDKCSVEGDGPLTIGLMKANEENKKLKEEKQQLEEELAKEEHIQTVPMTKYGQPYGFSGESVAAMETCLPGGIPPILTLTSNTTMPSPPPTCGPMSYDTQSFLPQTYTPNACGYEHLPAVHGSSSAITYSSPTPQYNHSFMPSTSYNSDISPHHKGERRLDRGSMQEYPLSPIGHDGYVQQPATTVSVPVVCHSQYKSSYSQASPTISCCSGSYPAVMSGYSQESMMTTAPVPVCQPQYTYGSSLQSSQVSPTTIATCCSGTSPSYQPGLYDGHHIANTPVMWHAEPRNTYNTQTNFPEPSNTTTQHSSKVQELYEHRTMQQLKDLQLHAANATSGKTSHRMTPSQAQQWPPNFHLQQSTPTYARPLEVGPPQRRYSERPIGSSAHVPEAAASSTGTVYQPHAVATHTQPSHAAAGLPSRCPCCSRRFPNRYTKSDIDAHIKSCK